jgi:tetratricopeptide (TPR) repeat protein
MITKENILFSIVGILAGLIIGFMFANYLNKNAALTPGGTLAANTALPQGHPSTANGESIAEVQAAIEIARGEPDNFDAQIKAAELFYQIQRFDGAVEFLERASKIRPDDVNTTVNLGNAYFDAGRYDDAERVYLQAIEKKPDDTALRSDLALTYVFRPNPDYDRAIAEFNRVLEQDPKNVLALQNMTVAYTKKGDANGANATLARLEETDAGNAAIAKLRDDIAKIGTPDAQVTPPAQ